MPISCNGWSVVNLNSVVYCGCASVLEINMNINISRVRFIRHDQLVLYDIRVSICDDIVAVNRIVLKGPVSIQMWQDYATVLVFYSLVFVYLAVTAYLARGFQMSVQDHL